MDRAVNHPFSGRLPAKPQGDRLTVGNFPKEFVMGQVSKNSRTSSTTHHFYCPCGGEVKMKTLFEDGRVKNVAECEKCKRTERRPSDFS
ncbi:hypothetical protein MASR2M48_26270 [Spirochaetota bacterium]|jgi:hypothetical protein